MNRVEVKQLSCSFMYDVVVFEFACSFLVYGYMVKPLILFVAHFGYS